ncbi:MAG: HIT family protein [Kiritimatiellae bacterium]|nr:HIT family protein [Kiritimatiellia bacterium]MDD5520631.1 HIT family protein [Kiritimatiellia bacterium]
MNSECIFCKIAAGELPSSKVYEDSDTFAFMDIGPVVKGHTLVIPKHHYDPITGTPDDVLHKLITVVKKIAQAQTEGLKADGINITQANGKIAGQIIPHVHFHVIPRFANDRHSWNWIPKKYDTPEEMHQFAGKIKSSLKS